MKKLICGLLALVCLSFVSPLAIAAQANWGTVNWYSDDTKVGIFYYAPTYRATLYSGTSFNSDFTILSYARDGMSAWCKELGYSPKYDTEKPLVRVRGGTDRDFADQNIFLDPNIFGYTSSPIYTSDVNAYVYGKGSKRSVGYQYEADVYILYRHDDGTTRGYTNTVFHELGHAFGYRGHTDNSNKVMYSSANGVITLQDTDKLHLTQIYDLWRKQK